MLFSNFGINDSDWIHMGFKLIMPVISDVVVGNVVLIVLVIAQCIMFIYNSLLTLNLPFEQLWFPVALYVIFVIIGIIMAIFKVN
jgi:hypothetical protein